MSEQIFQHRVLTWFDSNGRKDLPWQKNITPYQTWLSEVMLQQTQVVTVIPYFQRFIQQFPDVHALAAAPIDTVLQLWAGLGYYARARNLHKTAQIISQQEGEFPNQLDLLMALPGIGRSTAGAILSIAFNNSHPILDGNVRRVLARYHAISGWTGKASVANELWQMSQQHTPEQRCADYTQAMMDLGATVCTRSQPKCNECPLNKNCQALQQNLVSLLPTPKPTKKIPVKQTAFLLLQNSQQQILLEKRPELGVWGGLWSLPEFNTNEDIESWCQSHDFEIQARQDLTQQRHTFSHYHLDYKTIVLTVENPTNIVMEANQSVWYKVHQIKQLGLPTPIKRILQSVLS